MASLSSSAVRSCSSRRSAYIGRGPSVLAGLVAALICGVLWCAHDDRPPAMLDSLLLSLQSRAPPAPLERWPLAAVLLQCTQSSVSRWQLSELCTTSVLFNLFFEVEPFAAMLTAHGTYGQSQDFVLGALVRPEWLKFETKGREQGSIILLCVI